MRKSSFLGYVRDATGQLQFQRFRQFDRGLVNLWKLCRKACGLPATLEELFKARGECPRCEGGGLAFLVYPLRLDTCPRCKGDGKYRTRLYRTRYVPGIGWRNQRLKQRKAKT